MTQIHYQIRPLTLADAKNVVSIQCTCYPPELQESSAALLAKQALSPATCWLAEENRQPLGYLLTHPWHGHTLPPLHMPLDFLPENPDVFFLHDLAIHPKARGQGLGQALVNQATAWARDNAYCKAMLVAVQESERFWAKQGFHPLRNTSPMQLFKLAQYGAQARCLEKTLVM